MLRFYLDLQNSDFKNAQPYEKYCFVCGSELSTSWFELFAQLELKENKLEILNLPK